MANAQGSAEATLIAADAELSKTVFDSGANVLAGAVGTDGVLIWPGAAVVMGEQAASFFAHQPLMASARISWQPFRIEFSADSSVAMLVGVSVCDRPATGPILAIHRIGRYIAVWKRVANKWQLAAFTLSNLIAPGETIWLSSLGATDLPILHGSGPAAAFIQADSAFSADATTLGVSKGFQKWAAPDATTFNRSGVLNVGPDRIAVALATNTAHWQWGTVAAGASADGTLGWTVGQAVITPAGGGMPVKSKYLTVWRRMPDGTIRFIADGGNARP